MKICGHCQIPKILKDFHANKSRPDGVNGWCKTCMYPILKKNKKEQEMRRAKIKIEKSINNWKDLPNEQWKDIMGYEGLYQVSNMSRIRRIHGRWILKTPSKNKHLGYIVTTLSKNNKNKSVYYHRIVAQSFLPNPNNYSTVNHKNGDKADCSLENLEWCTAQQNTVHAIKVLERHNALYASRTPKCLRTPNIKKQINGIYAQARRLTQKSGINHVVDHISPLNGTNSSGLHVPWNLQIITKEENEHKSNHLIS